MGSTVLLLEHLSKRLNEQDIIYDSNLSVNRGEIIAVRGQTGSGKTTLLKMAAGLIIPTSGSVTISGNPVQPGYRNNSFSAGLLLHQEGVYKRLTVWQYLSFFQRLYGLKQDRIEEVIRLAGLNDRKKEKISHFSSSFISRLEMARVILHKPPVLLLDEPTSHLDLESMEILRKLIINSASEGAAVLLTTTSSEEAASLAHKTYSLNKGRLEYLETGDNSAVSNNTDADPMPVKHFKIEKIPAKVNDRIILFNPTELIYVESQDGVSLLHTPGEQFPCPLTLTELEGRLKPFGFFRSHRSYIVNLQRVREVIPWTRNSFSLVLNDEKKTTIPLSKNSLKELEGIIGM